jgi:hypothetical protein
MLQSIERITLSNSADTLILGVKSSLDGLNEIDAAEGIDTIDFAGSPSAITIDHLKVTSSGTQLKNFEIIVGTKFADTFKFSSIDDFTGLQKVDAAGQSDGTSDTLDFSGMAAGVGVTISENQFTATNTQLDNFEKIIGTPRTITSNIPTAPRRLKSMAAAKSSIQRI